MTKVRSPNYPAISLAEAISRIKSVYEQEQARAADKESIAKALGYGGINGAATTVIAALAKYGLLENAGTQLKISEDAESIILLNRGHPDHVKALKSVAFTPYLFSKLRDSFGEQLPNDNILRSFLIKKGFNPKIMDSVIRAYRDTLELLKAEEALSSGLSENEQLSDIGQNLYSQDPNPSYSAQTNVKLPTLQTSYEQTLLYRIAQDCTAHIQFNGPVTQEGIKKLINLLELNSDVFPKKESLKPGF
jgi:hypothetical protein